MAIGTAAAIGLGLAGVGGFLSSKSANKSAKTAAATEQNVANTNNALAREIYSKNEGYLAPYAESGRPANALLGGAAGYGDQDQYKDAFRRFIESSDYGFQFDQGANQVNSGYGGAGTLQSGAAMKDMERFRQNLQGGYRGEFNALLDAQQKIGLGAGSAMAGVGQNFVGTVSANNQNAGDAAANAALYRGANNPLANAISLLGGGAFGLAR